MQSVTLLIISAIAFLVSTVLSQPLPIPQFTRYVEAFVRTGYSVPWLDPSDLGKSPNSIPRTECQIEIRGLLSGSAIDTRYIARFLPYKNMLEVANNYVCRGFAPTSIPEFVDRYPNLPLYRSATVDIAVPIGTTLCSNLSQLFDMSNISVTTLIDNYETLMSPVTLTDISPPYTYYNYRAWTNTAPVCRSSTNQTCSSVAGDIGLRSGLLFELNVFPDKPTDTTCFATFIRTECVLPECGPPPQDCVLGDYGPYGDCILDGEVCTKKSVQPIIQEGLNGGYECPSIEARTRTVECTEVECDRVKCNYSVFEVYEPCIGLCGTSLVTILTVNASITGSPVCDPVVILQTEQEICATNMPCSRQNASEPVVPLCAIYGNTGFRNSSFLYVSIQFDANLTFNGTNGSLASQFRLSHGATNRTILIDPERSYVRNNEIRLYTSIDSDDAEGLTGSTVFVWYYPASSSNGSLFTIAGETFPSFSCSTEDHSPPSVVFVSAEQLPTLSPPIPYFFFKFSEDNIEFCNSSSPATTAILRITGATLLPNSSVIEFSSFEGGNQQWYGVSFPIEWSTSAVMYLTFNTSAFCDAAGNALVGYDSPILVNHHLNMTSVLPYDMKGSIKFTVDPVAQHLTSLLLVSVYPIEKSAITNSLIYFAISIVSSNASIAVSQPLAYAVKFDADSDYSDYASKATLLFSGDSATIGLNSSFSINYIGLENLISMPFQMSAVDYFMKGQISYFTAAYIVNVSAAPGSDDLRIRFSKLRSNNIPYGIFDVIYSGRNFVRGYVGEEDNGLVMILRMGFVYDYTMFQDTVTFFDQTAKGNPYINIVTVSNALGPRPTVVAAILSRTSDSLLQPNRLAIKYSTTIGYFGVANILTDSVKLNWTQPSISSVTAVDYAVVDDTITYVLSVTCVTTPCREALTNLFVSARGMFSEDSNLAASYEYQPVAVINSPSLVSVTEIQDGLFVLALSTAIQTDVETIRTALEPVPDECSLFSQFSAVCLFEATEFDVPDDQQPDCNTAGLEITLNTGSYTDLATNIGKVITQVTDCSVSDCTYGFGSLSTGSLIAAILSLTFGSVTIVCGIGALVWYFCRK